MDFENDQYDIKPEHLPEARRLFAVIRADITKLKEDMYQLMKLLKDR